MQIRSALLTDLEAGAQLWHDRIALLQQTDPAFRLLPDAAARWRAKAERWIADDEVGFFVATVDGELVGQVAVRVVAGQPGLYPERVGAVLEMAVDLHRASPGLSDGLLACAKDWLAKQGVRHLVIDVPARYPVEEAFWRARRARARFTRFWLET
ncbi:MAG: hypothetical protein OXG68_14440 [Chloroflexi bacterium]|nr:hypothetical protein [Chloroflexota bacterium]